MSIKKRKRIVLFFLLLLILSVSCLGLLWKKNTKSPSKQDTTKESVQEEKSVLWKMSMRNMSLAHLIL